MTEDDEPARPKKAMIFTSYGWRDAADAAVRIAEELAAAGYEVWIDRERIRPGQKFPEVIRNAIHQADVILVLISPHSVRLPGDPDNADDGASVCLNEILQAHEERKPIVPVIVVPCEPPWLINIVERIEFFNHTTDEKYRLGLSEILRRLALAQETGRTIFIPAIERLHPLDFRNELVRGAGEFAGRQWLFERIEAWVGAPQRCLVIEGDAGTGKSAFVAELLRRDPVGRTLAYHFCRADQTSTIQAAEFVRSIAAMAGGRIQSYGAQLNSDDLRVRLIGDACAADPLQTLFTCVINPLAQLPDVGSRYIVIDALDEALAVRGGSQGLTIPRLLTLAIPDLPAWLKIIVTMRRDDRLRAQFADAAFVRLGVDEPLQRADIAAYLARRPDLSAHAQAEDAADAIEKRSAGNFLYAKQVANAFVAGDFRTADIDRLPNGLEALFSQAFQSRFPDASSFAKPARILGVLLAAKEPLTPGQIATIAELDLREAVLPCIEKLTGYVVPADTARGPEQRVTLFHKSLADWLRAPTSGMETFKADTAGGQARMLDWCRNWANSRDRYLLVHALAHLLDAGAVDEVLAAVRGGFFVQRAQVLSDSRADLEDTMALVAALAKKGDEIAIIELATSGSSWQRDGVAAAMQHPFLMDLALADRIVGRLLALPMSDPSQPSAAVLSARRTAIRVAEARRLTDRLLQAARDKSSAVRVSLATLVYRCWLRDRAEGWSLIEKLAGQMLGPLALPRAEVLETFGHASLAILNNHQHEPDVMARLLSIWRTTVEKLMRGPVVRVVGNRWMLRILLMPLAELMKRQPAYQPLNAREIAVTFARGEAFRRNWQLALHVLEHPESDLEALAAMLCRKDIPFDVYLMLVSERALIVAASRDPDATFAILERLFMNGAPWFRQSVLYVLFHVLSRAKAIDEERLERYREMTEAFFAQDKASMTTEVASYSFAPHLAWPEIVHAAHRPGAGPWLLPRLLRRALDAGDETRAALVFKAIDLAGFAYGRPTLALALITEAAAIGGLPVEDRIVESLANVRFEDEALVDEFLEKPEFAALKGAVHATSPTIRGEDIPTWIDGFVVQSMLTSEAFRGQICDAFRRALDARNASEFLMQILVWVVNLLAGRAVAR